MTPGVSLSPLTAADEAEFVAAAKASRVLHGRWVSPPTTGAAFRQRLARLEGGANLAYLARRRSDGALAGYLEITNIVRGNFRSGYVGYYAFAGHERRGRMTQALRQLVRLAFARLSLHRLEANVQPENKASIALLKAAGFRREGYSPRYLKIRGRWRDHERWAIVAR